MEKLLLQEHESKQLRVERHSLKVGFEAANMTLDRMENEAVTLKQQLKEEKEHGAFRNEDINDSRIGNQIDQEVRQVIIIILNIDKQS
jgi:adenylate cyclase